MENKTISLGLGLSGKYVGSAVALCPYIISTHSKTSKTSGQVPQPMNRQFIHRGRRAVADMPQFRSGKMYDLCLVDNVLVRAECQRNEVAIKIIASYNCAPRHITALLI